MQIHFLTEEEWEAELNDLLAEALNDEGKLKRVFEGESPQVRNLGDLQVELMPSSWADLNPALWRRRWQSTSCAPFTDTSPVGRS